jgi:hypothetical protein
MSNLRRKSASPKALSSALANIAAAAPRRGDRGTYENEIYIDEVNPPPNS